MKSPMVENAGYIKDAGRYSDLQVLHSGGGFYVGTIYENPDGYSEPGSRDSDYFSTLQQAETHLAAIVADDAPTRMSP